MAGPVNDDPNKDDLGNDPQRRQDKSPPPRSARQHRRWPYVLLAIVGCIIIGLIVLAIVLPTAVSTHRGTRYAIAIINDRIRGHLDVRKIDLSWRGPVELQGVVLQDPQKRRVLSADRVVVQAGLWHLIRSPMTFGQIDLYHPDTNVYMRENQPPSLVQAVEMRGTTTQPAATRPVKPAASQPVTEAPAPKGKLTIHGGSARIIKPDGQELSLSDINSQVSLDTLNNVNADLAAQLASGGQVQANAHVRNLVDNNGQINLNNATGQFAVQTPQPVALAPVTAFADQPGIGGRAVIDLRGSLERGTLLADIKTTIDNFYAAQQRGPATQPAPAMQSKPIDLALVGRVESNSQRTNARFDLTGGGGTAQAKVAYVPSTQPTNVTSQEVMDTLLTGKPINLPNVAVNAQGELNLPALADAAPRFLRIRKNVRITSGHLQIQDLAVRTEPQLASSGGIHLVDLAAVQNGQPVQWQPIALNWNAHVQPDVGLQVEQGQLQSAFAQANLKGTPENLRGQFQTDLAKLDEQMRQLVDMGNLRLAGGIQGQFQLARANPNQVNLNSQITANNLQYRSGETRLDIRQATMNPNGSLVLRNNQLQQAVLKETKVDVDQQVQATTAGTYNFGPKSWDADLNIEDAQIPYLLTLAHGLGIHALDQYQGYRGQIHLPITASYNPQAGTIASNGDGNIRDLGVGNNTAIDMLSIKWQHLAYAPGKGLVSVPSATVQAANGNNRFLNVVASEVEFRPGKNMAVRGKVNADAQVQPTLAAAYTLAQKPAPNLAGQLHMTSNLQTEGQTIGLAGQATVDNLQVGAGQQTVRQEQVRLNYDAQVDNQSSTVNIRQAALQSAPLSAKVNGTVHDFRTTQVLDIHGQYEADWDQVMPIVYEFSPGMKDTVALHGKDRDEFTVRGPADDPNAQPAFRGLTTQGLAVGWQSGRVYGVDLGAGKLEPTLADGVLKLPKTTIPASGGSINLGATIDMTTKTPTLHMPGQTRLLDNINLNGQIGRQLLSYVNPLFSDVTGMEGKVSMVLQDIEVPLGEAIKQTGTGHGQLFMENVRVAPTGAFGALAKIAMSAQPGQGGRGQSGQQQGRFGALNELGAVNPLGGAGQQAPLGQAEQQPGAVDIRIGNPTFEISNGKIHYDNFTMAFPNGVDMVFSGWVGFDDSMKMYVGVPVTAGLLQMAGVKGPTAQYASVLQGARVDVPIAGTRTSSRLDFASIKIQPLVDQAIRNLAAQGIQQGIRTAVPGAALVPGLVPGSGQQGQGPSLPGEGIIRGILPGGQQQNQQQTSQQQTGQQQQGQQQEGQQQQQQQGGGLPGEGLLKNLLPGHK